MSDNSPFTPMINAALPIDETRVDEILIRKPFHDDLLHWSQKNVNPKNEGPIPTLWGIKVRINENLPDDVDWIMTDHDGNVVATSNMEIKGAGK